MCFAGFIDATKLHTNIMSRVRHVLCIYMNMNMCNKYYICVYKCTYIRAHMCNCGPTNYSRISLNLRFLLGFTLLCHRCTGHPARTASTELSFGTYENIPSFMFIILAPRIQLWVCCTELDCRNTCIYIYINTKYLII